jgi:hypothetical protein
MRNYIKMCYMYLHMLHRTQLISVWCARTLLTFSAHDWESWCTVAYVYCIKNLLGSIYCTMILRTCLLYRDPAHSIWCEGSCCLLYGLAAILLSSPW